MEKIHPVDLTRSFSDSVAIYGTPSVSIVSFNDTKELDRETFT